MKQMLVLAFASGGCGDAVFVSSSVLDHPQILAVRAEPPQVPPQGLARIDVLAGDQAGHVFVSEPETITAETLEVSHTEAGWFVHAGDLPGVTVTITLTIDGESWRAEKLVTFGPETTNPEITSLRVDGSDAIALTAAPGARPELAALASSTEGSEPLAYSWYSSLGEVEHFLDQTARLHADMPAEGEVVVVVRDGAGGVGWRMLPGHIEATR